uniref:Seryl tRNA synthetase n=1 Tax=Streptomyces sp. K01-0509 TaxID=1238679 RepID=K4JII4_9ACTN|nr:seryl tRNA synthetase [Streptomyces sp. K01-0509]
MPTVHVRLSQRVPETLAPELMKRLFFAASSIEEFQLFTEDGSVVGVELTLNSADSAGVAEKIDRVVAEQVLTQRPLAPRSVWESPVVRSEFTDAFPELLAQDTVVVSGEGQVGFAEPLISLFGYLDRRLRAIALSLEGAREYQYPTLLPTSVLDRFGYFGSFPQFPMFVTRLHNDIDVYADFVERYREEQRVPDDLFAHCSNTDYCLPPTMCYHSFHQYQGRELAGGSVITARGKSFRYESRYHTSLERLWDFTIREIVFMGTPEFAAECRNSVMRQTFALMEELELAGGCEVANDHFFANADTAGKILSQRMMELKFEPLLPVAADRSIAVGSFNLHGHFFGESFDIKGPDGGPVASGCVGFGLERLGHAFLSQHGSDPARWPTAVAQEIG